jgi:acetoin utilization deacetylase AcuC-like enzyme
MHSEGYRRLTKKLLAIADELCGGRMFFTQEGGYSRWTVPFHGLAVLEELSGISTQVVDPYLDYLKSVGGHEVQPHHEVIINAAAENVSRIPQHR